MFIKKSPILLTKTAFNSSCVSFQDVKTQKLIKRNDDKPTPSHPINHLDKIMSCN